MYINIELACHTPERNVMIYANYTSIFEINFSCKKRHYLHRHLGKNLFTTVLLAMQQSLWGLNYNNNNNVPFQSPSSPFYLFFCFFVSLPCPSFAHTVSQDENLLSTSSASPFFLPRKPSRSSQVGFVQRNPFPNKTLKHP